MRFSSSKINFHQMRDRIRFFSPAAVASISPQLFFIVDRADVAEPANGLLVLNEQRALPDLPGAHWSICCGTGQSNNRLLVFSRAI